MTFDKVRFDLIISEQLEQITEQFQQDSKSLSVPLEQIEYDLTFQGDLNTFFRIKLLELFHQDSKSLLVPLKQIKYDLTFQDNLNIFRTKLLELFHQDSKSLRYSLNKLNMT